MKRLLITGASGFLGWNISRIAKSDWTVFGTSFYHTLPIQDVSLMTVDLTLLRDLKRLFDDVKPDAVIHTAAMTDPNLCQQNRTLSHNINTKVPINIAGLCSGLDIPCLFTSSDLVFDGLTPPYSEDDEPSPISFYGEQKAMAEAGMKDRYPSTVICRMPLMFGDPGPMATSFIQLMLRAIQSGKTIDLFTDEFRTPVSGRDAAKGLLMVLNIRPGMIHLGGSERISRYEFGKLLCESLGLSNARLNPCRQQDLKMSAPRPPDVSLDSTRARALGFNPKSLKEEMEALRE
ncbi:MAG: NAD(P)-dependent oxidoreductase [Deltaproteobacteria bacterium]|nr:NAD(P)-dependent oxidoreductase [Deltaproteobacteria bacterium]